MTHRTPLMTSRQNFGNEAGPIDEICPFCFGNPATCCVAGGAVTGRVTVVAASGAGPDGSQGSILSGGETSFCVVVGLVGGASVARVSGAGRARARR